MVVETGDKELNNNNHELKNKIKNTEQKIRATLIYLKAFTDIINSLQDLKNDNSDKKIISDPNQIEDEEIEIEEGSEVDSEKTEMEKRISTVIIQIFQNSNYESLQKMLNINFLSNLIYFFSNLTIEEFLLNDFDKMIVIKELLYELEYITLSLINNIIINVDGLFSKFIIK